MFIFLGIWCIMEVARGRLDQDIDPVAAEMFPIPVYGVTMMLAVFTLITGLMHFFAYANPGPSYQRAIDGGHNWKRWLEYSMTATIMLVVIAMSSGIHNGITLTLIATCSAVCMVLGYISEQLAATKQITASRWATACGWVLLLVAYGTILYRFNEVVSDAGQEGPPSWVYGIVWSMFFLFMSFGIIHLIHMIKQWNGSSSPSFNRSIDGTYTIASAVAKITLVVFLASGLYARSSLDR
jgi:hypothetical protein